MVASGTIRVAVAIHPVVTKGKMVGLRRRGRLNHVPPKLRLVHT